MTGAAPTAALDVVRLRRLAAQISSALGIRLPDAKHAMLFGRLEIFTFLVLLTPAFWKR